MKKMKKYLGMFFIAVTLIFVTSIVVPEVTGCVTVEAASLSLKYSKMTLIKGQSRTLKVARVKSKVKWTSSNTRVATVNSKGKVIARGRGKATITAKADGKRGKCTVIVEEPGFSSYEENHFLTEKKSMKLSIIGTSQKIRWESSNTKIASVNQKGVVTAKKKGVVKISATISGKKFVCKVTVLQRLYTDKYKLTISDETTIDIIDNVIEREVWYTNENPTIVSCKWGERHFEEPSSVVPLIITPKNPGTAKIKIYTQDDAGNIIDYFYITVISDVELNFTDEEIRGGYAVRFLYSMLKKPSTFKILNAGYFVNDYGRKLVLIDYSAINSYGDIVYKNLTVDVQDSYSTGSGYLIKPNNYPAYIAVYRNSPRYDECTSELDIDRIIQYANTEANYKFTYFKPYYSWSWYEKNPLLNEVRQ